ncbi:MAG: Gfo/Idh/MocA family oxidoreductase, partial [Longimicrobiales bacterium]
RPDAGDTLVQEQCGRAEPVVHTVAAADEYRIMVEQFADAVLHDRPHRCTAAEAALNMRVIEALYRSARDGGKPVSVGG